MKKNITAIALAAGMTLSLVPNAFAENSPNFEIYRSSQYSVVPGDEVTYTVQLNNAESITQIGSILEYDKDILTYVNAKKSMNFSYNTSSDNFENAGNTVQAGITFSGSYNVTSTPLYDVTFKVNDDVKEDQFVAPVHFQKAGITYSGSYTPKYVDTNERDTEIYIGETPEIVLNTDSNDLKCGDETEVIVSSDKEFSADGLKLKFDYDSEYFELVKAEPILSGLSISDDGKTAIFMSTSGEKKISGNLMKLTLKAKKTVSDTKITSYGSTISKSDVDNDIMIGGSSLYYNIAGSLIVSPEIDKNEVKVGDKVHVSVVAKNCENLSGLKATVNYDSASAKLASAPMYNFVPTKVGTATMYEEGTINYIFLSANEANNLNGDVVMMEFDLISTSAGSTDISIDVKESDPEGVAEGGSTWFNSVNQDDETVQKVISLIDEIPEITSDNYKADDVKNAIKVAEDAYNSLSDAKKAMIGNVNKLNDAKSKINEINKEKAEEVQKALDALTVTEENYKEAPAAIAAVENAYKELTDEQKVLVKDYDEKIKAANDAYNEFVKNASNKEAADKVNEMITALDITSSDFKSQAAVIEYAYNALTEEQKALVDYAAYEAKVKAYNDKAAADNVSKMIEALDINKDSFETDAKAAKAAYDALTEEQKALVDYAAYGAKVKAYNDKAAADNVSEMIEALDINRDSFEADAKAAKAAYDALTEEQKALVKNYADYEKKIADYANMKDIIVTVQKLGSDYSVSAKEQKKINSHQIVVAAVYSSNGALLSTKTITSDNGNTVISGGENTTIKTFVWNSLNEMKPYESVETLVK